MHNRGCRLNSFEEITGEFSGLTADSDDAIHDTCSSQIVASGFADHFIPITEKTVQTSNMPALDTQPFLSFYL